jgi:hypothetical protein
MGFNIKRLLWESKLAIALVLLIVARCVDRVLYTCVCLGECDKWGGTQALTRASPYLCRRITYDYVAFLWYFSNVITPIAFVVTTWPVVWYKMYFTDEITPEMRAFPHYKYAIMALLDTLYNMLGAFPTPHIGYALPS